MKQTRKPHQTYQQAREAAYQDQHNRMLVGYAIGTLKQLGNHFESASEAGYKGWYVLTSYDGWQLAETASELCDVVQQEQAYRRRYPNAKPPQPE